MLGHVDPPHALPAARPVAEHSPTLPSVPLPVLDAGREGGRTRPETRKPSAVATGRRASSFETSSVANRIDKR